MKEELEIRILSKDISQAMKEILKYARMQKEVSWGSKSWKKPEMHSEIVPAHILC